MRVLGVDPGLTRCGLGVVEGTPGKPPVLVAVGVIRTPAELDVAERLVRIEAGIGLRDGGLGLTVDVNRDWWGLL